MLTHTLEFLRQNFKFHRKFAKDHYLLAEITNKTK